jgi:hypothetical protein
LSRSPQLVDGVRADLDADMLCTCPSSFAPYSRLLLSQAAKGAAKEGKGSSTTTPSQSTTSTPLTSRSANESTEDLSASLSMAKLNAATDRCVWPSVLRAVQERRH